MRKTVSPVASIATALLFVFVASPSSALPSDHKQLEKNKDVVERFFRIANSGKVAELNAIVREDYVEHTDIRDFRAGLAEAIASNPATPITATYEAERHRIRGDIVRMIAERDHVWTFSAVVGPQSRVARIDMFRLSDGQIAEHWAVVQQVPDKSQHNNDSFGLGQGPQDYKKQPRRISRVTTEKEADLNRRLGRAFYQYFWAGDIKGMDSIMGMGYIQHHPGHPDGGWPVMRENMVQTMAILDVERAKLASGQVPPRPPYGPVRILTEGNLVWVLVENGQQPAQFNQYTVVDGRLGEHFGTYETFPLQRLNNNSFFGYGRGPAYDFSD